MVDPFGAAHLVLTRIARVPPIITHNKTPEAELRGFCVSGLITRRG